MGPVPELLPFLLVVAGLAFVGLPLIMWRLLGEDATPRYEPFDPSRHATPPEVGAFIRDNLAALAAAPAFRTPSTGRKAPRDTAGSASAHDVSARRGRART